MIHAGIQQRFAHWLACAMVLLSTSTARPGEPKARGPAAPLTLRHWTTEDGLPKNTVLSLLQTKDGYLWVGTREGLARFDGLRFKPFTEELRIDDADLSCLDLLEDTRGCLWVRLPSGLVCYDHGRFEKFSIRSGPLAGVIQAVIASRYGGLWVGTPGAGLKRFEDGHYTRVYRTQEGLTSNYIGPLREDRDGRVWIGSFQGGPGVWQRLDPRTGEVTPLSRVVGATFPDIRDLLPGADGRLWLFERQGLLCWNGGKLVRFATPGGQVWPMGIAAMANSRDALWFAPAFGRTLVRFQQGQFEEFGTDDGLADTDFRALLWDREGSLWIGMGAGGLQRLRPRSVLSLCTTNPPGRRQPIESVAAGRDGVVWLGTWEALLRWEDGGIQRFTNSIPWEEVTPTARFELAAHPVLEDRSGQVWFGARNRGLFTLEAGEVRPVAAANEGRTNWTVRVLYEDRSGTLWVGSDSGLLQKQGDRFVRYNGLLNMRQRIESLGGNWSLESTPGQGTRLDFRIPLTSFRGTST